MKILIPLDGSKTGEAALPYVTGLLSMMSPRAKMGFVLIRVVPFRAHYVAVGDVMSPVPYTEAEMEQIRRYSFDYLTQVGEDLKSKGVDVTVKVETGNAGEEIVRVADEMDVDLIAMSTHGRSGISRWAFGSVTDKVLHAGHKPVLVVRAPKETEK